MNAYHLLVEQLVVWCYYGMVRTGTGTSTILLAGMILWYHTIIL
jgi:hypothetical protein